LDAQVQDLRLAQEFLTATVQTLRSDATSTKASLSERERIDLCLARLDGQLEDMQRAVGEEASGRLLLMSELESLGREVAYMRRRVDIDMSPILEDVRRSVRELASAGAAAASRAASSDVVGEEAHRRLEARLSSLAASLPQVEQMAREVGDRCGQDCRELMEQQRHTLTATFEQKLQRQRGEMEEQISAELRRGSGDKIQRDLREQTAALEQKLQLLRGELEEQISVGCRRRSGDELETDCKDLLEQQRHALTTASEQKLQRHRGELEDQISAGLRQRSGETDCRDLLEQQRHTLTAAFEEKVQWLRGELEEQICAELRRTSQDELEREFQSRLGPLHQDLSSQQATLKTVLLLQKDTVQKVRDAETLRPLLDETRSQLQDLQSAMKQLEPQGSAAEDKARTTGPSLASQSALETRLEQVCESVAVHERALQELSQRQHCFDDRLKQVDQIQPAVQTTCLRVQELALAVQRFRREPRASSLGGAAAASRLGTPEFADLCRRSLDEAELRKAQDGGPISPLARVLVDLTYEPTSAAAAESGAVAAAPEEGGWPTSALHDVVLVQREANQTLKRVEDFAPALEDTRQQLQDLVAVVKLLEPLKDRLSSHVQAEIQEALASQSGAIVASVDAGVRAELEAALEETRQRVEELAQAVDQCAPWPEVQDGIQSSFELHKSALTSQLDEALEAHGREASRHHDWLREEASRQQLAQDGIQSSLELHKSALTSQLDEALEAHGREASRHHDLLREEVSRQQLAQPGFEAEIEQLRGEAKSKESALSEALSVLQSRLEKFREDVFKQQANLLDVSSLQRSADSKLQQLERMAPELEDTRRRVQELAQAVDQCKPWREVQSTLQSSIKEEASSLHLRLDAKLEQHREETSRQQLALTEVSHLQREADRKLQQVEDFAPALEQVSRHVRQLASAVAKVEPSLELLPETVRKEIQDALKRQIIPTLDVQLVKQAGQLREEAKHQEETLRESLLLLQNSALRAMQDRPELEQRCAELEERMTRLEIYLGDSDKKHVAEVEVAHAGIADLCGQLADSHGAQERWRSEVERRFNSTERRYESVEGLVSGLASTKGHLQELSGRLAAEEDVRKQGLGATTERLEFLEVQLGGCQEGCREKCREMLQEAHVRLQDLHQLVVKETSACQRQQSQLKERLSHLEASEAAGNTQQQQLQLQQREQLALLEASVGDSSQHSTARVQSLSAQLAESGEASQRRHAMLEGRLSALERRAGGTVERRLASLEHRLARLEFPSEPSRLGIADGPPPTALSASSSSRRLSQGNHPRAPLESWAALAPSSDVGRLTEVAGGRGASGGSLAAGAAPVMGGLATPAASTATPAALEDRWESRAAASLPARTAGAVPSGGRGGGTFGGGGVGGGVGDGPEDWQDRWESSAAAALPARTAGASPSGGRSGGSGIGGGGGGGGDAPEDWRELLRELRRESTVGRPAGAGRERFANMPP